MALFHQHDEEDDFDGVEQRDRAVIPYVKAAIMNELMARRFLVVLHNGSGSYIDPWEAGVPVIGQLSRRVLSTSRGRFGHHAKDGHGTSWWFHDVESAKWSDATISVMSSLIFEEDTFARLQILRHALYAEAEEVAKYTGVPEPDMTPRLLWNVSCIGQRETMTTTSTGSPMHPTIGYVMGSYRMPLMVVGRHGRLAMLCRGT